MELAREYGVETAIYFPLLKASSNDFAGSSDYTYTAGDIKISKDGGAAADPSNSPTVITMGNGYIWKLVLTASEMQAKKVVVTIIDAATKAIQDQAILIITYGNANAELDTEFPSKSAVASQVDTTLSSSHGSGSWVDNRDVVVRSGTLSGTPSEDTLEDSSITETTDDHYAGLLLVMTSGDAQGQARWVEHFLASSKELVLSEPLLDAPSASDTYNLLAIRSLPMAMERG